MIALQKKIRSLVLASVALLGVTGCSDFFGSKSRAEAFDATAIEFDANTYPAVVLGGGVGGLTAGIYLAMANVKTLLVQGPVPGGLLTQSLSVRNWPGELDATGLAITDKIVKQAEQQGVEMSAEQVVAFDAASWPYTVTLGQISDPTKTRTIKALSVVVAMGALSRYLGIPGEQEYWSKGVTNCAVCEGSLYKDKVVCVVGGGNSAIEEAHYLAGLAKKVFVFVRGSALRATDNRKDEVLAMPNVELVYHHSPVEVLGDGQRVTGVRVANNKTKKEENYAVDGVFLAIGFTPNTALFRNIVALDGRGYITLTAGQQTSVAGIFAVGDIVDPIYKQAVTAAGDGCRSALQAHQFLLASGYRPQEKRTAAAAVVDASKAEDKKEEAKSEQPAAEQKKSSVEDVYAPGATHDIRSSKEFAALVHNATKPILVDFHATWCGPCRQMAPLYKKLAQAYEGRVIFTKVNIDDLGGVATEYRIQGVPTFTFIKGGVEVDRIVGGGITEKQFAARIDAVLA